MTPTQAREMAARLAIAYSEIGDDRLYHRNSLTDIRCALCSLADQVEELRALDCDPTEGLPGALTEIARRAASGCLIDGGEIEVIEEAARRLRAVEAQQN